MEELCIGPDSPGSQEMTVFLQVAIKIMDKRQLGEDLPRIRLEIAAMKVGGGAGAGEGVEAGEGAGV